MNTSFFSKTLILIAFLGIELSSLAQAPGYMGKTKIISYDLYMFPAFVNPNYNGNTGITSFNFRHVINFDFVTNIRQTIGISASYIRTNSIFKRPVNGHFTYIHDGGNMYAQELSFGKTMAELKVYGISVNLKYFLNKEYIAPLGLYFKPEISLFILNSSFDPEEMKPNVYLDFANDHSYEDELLTYPNIQNNISFYTAGVSLVIGKQAIYLDKFVTNIGLEMGYVFGSKMLSNFTDGLSSNNYTQVMGKSRLLGINFINVVAGIGYIW